MPKPFLSYAQQIAFLKSKGLIISNEVSANNALMRIGYFQLINGYKHLFKNPTTKQYRDDVHFEDILALYRFDENLRHLFLRYLLIVEKTIKTQIAYAFCYAYGDAQCEYLNPTRYNCTIKTQAGVQKLIGVLDKLANHPTDYPYINRHQAVYNNVPLWVLINAITFGNTSKMFSFLPQSMQSDICKNHPVSPKQMMQMLSVLTKFRNVCAHGERLFSYQTNDDIPDFPLHQKLTIPKKGSQYIYGKRDLFSVVISFRYLLPTNEFLTLKKSLAGEVMRLLKSCKSLTEPQVLSAMGFPENWKDITRYKR